MIGRRIVLCSALLLAAGCRSTPAVVANRSHSAATTAVAVSKVHAVWTDAVLRQGEVPVAQGFTSRVYLVDSGTTDPAAADGTFKFYAFEETSSLAPRQQPAKPKFQWEFSADEAKLRLSKDPLGWGYSFWLPCDAPANVDRRFSLIARFTPANGKPLASEPTLIHLPTLGDSKVRGVTFRYDKTPNASSAASTTGCWARLDGINPSYDD